MRNTYGTTCCFYPKVIKGFRKGIDRFESIQHDFLLLRYIHLPCFESKFFLLISIIYTIQFS